MTVAADQGLFNRQQESKSEWEASLAEEAQSENIMD